MASGQHHPEMALSIAAYSCREDVVNDWNRLQLDYKLQKLIHMQLENVCQSNYYKMRIHEQTEYIVCEEYLTAECEVVDIDQSIASIHIL